MTPWRDRDGSLLDHHPLEDDDWTPHEHRCHDGWLGETTDGRPIPCHTCRPWLNTHRQPNTRR